MTGTQKRILAINVIGGVAVLGSYAYGISSNTHAGDKLWGGVPESIRPYYTVSMFLAAIGFLTALTFLTMRKVSVTLSRPHLRRLVYASYVLILIPSAIWMSLTFHYVADPTALRWWIVRAVLFAVSAGALALIYALVKLRPAADGLSWLLAIVGSGLFAFHAIVLDALLWPYLYHQ